MIYQGHTKKINGFAWSHDASRVLTAADDNMIYSWQLGSSKNVGAFVGHTSYVDAITTSPKDNSFVTSSTDKSTKLWDLRSSKEQNSFSTSSSVFVLAFSRCGNYVAMGQRDHKILVCDVRKWAETKSFSTDKDEAKDITFTPSSQHIAITSLIGNVCYFDNPFMTNGIGLSSKQSPEISSSPTPPLSPKLKNTNATLPVFSAKYGSGKSYCIEFSPMGNQFAIGSFDSLLSFWSFPENICTLQLPFLQKSVRSISWHNSGATLAVALEHSPILMIDPENGRTTNRFTIDTNHAVRKIACSPKGNQIAFCFDTQDQEGCNLFIIAGS